MFDSHVFFLVFSVDLFPGDMAESTHASVSFIDATWELALHSGK